jgi:two-component system sensor histidine kinase KdpD
MTRGRLHVLLGAAPGVGKTYAMLEEGHRLAEAGRRVLIGVVEAHGRPETAALADGLAVAPRRRVSHRGAEPSEMDTDAILAAAPDLVLVDELAHANAPRSRHERRWQDVEDLLEGGLCVVTTVDVQHIESLNDVVEQITGVPQRETVPDEVLRRADEVELVDLAPEALRARLAEGKVYPPERIDAALSNYFRLGNLTAMRELALLWLADNVEEALRDYRSAHHIEALWETRERVVVALAGDSWGEALARRGARIAARSGGGDLLAVHVTSQDGLRSAVPGSLARQRELVEKLGGTYHQLVGESVPEALLGFARSHDATQLVLGASRRTRLGQVLGGPGVGAEVIRAAGPIDVHIVSRPRRASGPRLPARRGALSPRRRALGFLLTFILVPAMAWIAGTTVDADTLTVCALAFQLIVVVVALVGGLWPALLAALSSGLALDFFLIAPYRTIAVSAPRQLVILLLDVLIAVLVSLVVDRSARRGRQARRAAAESEILIGLADSVLRADDALGAILSTTREAFGVEAVCLRGPGGGSSGRASVLVRDGDPEAPGPRTTVPVGEGADLTVVGRDLDASDQRLLGVVATQLRTVLDHRDLETRAREIGPLEAANKVRSALLSAVSHDVRRPLAAATAAVTGLSSMGAELGEDDRAELLGLARDSLDDLASLVTDLLDVSRVQAGAIPVDLGPVDAADAILPALDELHAGPDGVELALDPALPRLRADPALLRRVLVNLLANARRFSPPGVPVLLTTSSFGGTGQIRVVDHGPGIPQGRREDVFRPFQRLGDTDNTSGLGLGLALSKGFVDGMGGGLEAEDTPGGGLTMVVSLPCVQEDGP